MKNYHIFTYLTVRSGQAHHQKMKIFQVFYCLSLYSIQKKRNSRSLSLYKFSRGSVIKIPFRALCYFYRGTIKIFENIRIFLIENLTTNIFLYCLIISFLFFLHFPPIYKNLLFYRLLRYFCSFSHESQFGNLVFFFKDLSCGLLVKFY